MRGNTDRPGADPAGSFYCTSADPVLGFARMARNGSCFCQSRRRTMRTEAGSWKAAASRRPRCRRTACCEASGPPGPARHRYKYTFETGSRYNGDLV